MPLNTRRKPSSQKLSAPRPRRASPRNSTLFTATRNASLRSCPGCRACPPRASSISAFAPFASKLFPVLAAVDDSFKKGSLTDDARWLRDNSSLVYSELSTVQGDLKLLRKLPHVRSSAGRSAAADSRFRAGILPGDVPTTIRIRPSFPTAADTSAPRLWNSANSRYWVGSEAGVARRNCASRRKVVDEPDGPLDGSRRLRSELARSQPDILGRSSSSL